MANSQLSQNNFMESKIIKQEKNPFLEREEITIEIKNPNTPNADEVKEAIGKDSNLTVIKKINTNFGNQTFIAEAVIYDNLETKNKIETTPQKIRKKMEADNKAAKEAEKKAADEAAKAEAEPKPEEQPETPVEEPANDQRPTTNDQTVEEPKPEEKTE